MPRTCPACGRAWTDRAIFCGACGALLAPVTTTGDESPSPRSRRWGRGAVVAALVAAGTAVALAVPSVDVPLLGSGDVRDDTVALPTAPTPGEAPPATTSSPRPIRCTRARVPVDCLAWDIDTGEEISLGPRLPGAGVLVNRESDALVVRDAGTGAVRWQRDDLGQLLPVAVVDDVLVLGRGGRPARGMDIRDGDVLWTVDDVQPIGALSDLEPALVVLGRQAPGDEGVSGLVALDPTTGSVQWEWPVPWSGPVRTSLQPAGTTGILVTGAGQLARVDAATGRTAWQVDTLPDAYLQPQPPGHVSAQQLAGDDGAELWIHDVDSGTVVQRLPAARVATHLVVDGVVVVHAPPEGVVRGMDLATGERRWQLLLEGVGGLGFPVRAAHDAVVVVLEREARRVTRIDARTGEPVWQTELQPSPVPRGSGMFFGQPMLVGDVVIIEDTSSVITVLDVATGRERVRVAGGPRLDVRSVDPLTLVQDTRWMRVAIPPAEPGDQ